MHRNVSAGVRQINTLTKNFECIAVRELIPNFLIYLAYPLQFITGFSKNLFIHRLEGLPTSHRVKTLLEET